jgi:hypothetical protein
MAAGGRSDVTGRRLRTTWAGTRPLPQAERVEVSISEHHPGPEVAEELSARMGRLFEQRLTISDVASLSEMCKKLESIREAAEPGVVEDAVLLGNLTVSTCGW